jgi:hypothetical protein
MLPLCVQSVAKSSSPAPALALAPARSRRGMGAGATGGRAWDRCTIALRMEGIETPLPTGRQRYHM